MDYPLGFLREIDGITKDEILKEFIDVIWEDAIDLETIPNQKLKAAWIRLMIEADKAAVSMEGKLASIQSGIRENRKSRRTKTAKERAKEAGLVVLEPNVSNAGKLIIE